MGLTSHAQKKSPWFQLDYPLVEHENNLSGGASSEAEEISHILREMTPPLPGKGAVYRRSMEGFGGGVEREKEFFSILSHLKVMVSQVAMHLDASFRRDLFAQLDDLLNLDDWHDEDNLLKAESFLTYLRLVIFAHITVGPRLGISDEGFLIAGWASKKGRLTVEFLSKDRLRIALIHTVDDDTEQLTMKTSVSRFVEVLTPYRVENWIGCREQKQTSS